MATNSNDVLVTLLSSIGGLATVIAGGRGAQALVQRKTKARKKAIDTGSVPTVPPATVSEQQEFLTTVIRDNDDLRKRIKVIEDTVAQMREDQDFVHAREQTFSEALGRWLRDVYAAWGKAGSFPLPTGNDLVVLRDVIPR